MRKRSSRYWTSRLVFGGSVGMLVAGAGCAPPDPGTVELIAQASHNEGGSGGTPPDPVPLGAVPVPQPIGGDIVNQAAAIRLGKALFWDIQAGGDGQTACASCHFKAGADDRRRNTIHPGPNGSFQEVSGPGQLWDGSNLFSDDIVGSQGVVRTNFTGINPDSNVAADICTTVSDPQFLLNRRVTGRNTPPAIGAVFFRDNFWDGRANNRFNGKNPFGNTGNNTEGNFVDVQNASLASQAVGPPNNDVEMSCAGRTFNGTNSLAAKMLARTPLGKQLVSPTDSVLGSLSRSPANGLNTTYTDMVAAAFGATLAANAQNQFSRLWGQAIAAYEATLIPSDTPFDRFLAGNTSAMTSSQREGWAAFKDPNRANCFGCHAGSELSDATVSFAALKGLINVDGGDQGYHNLGLRPTSEDLGRGGTGPNGVSWSVSGSSFDRGAFKTPALRNIKLTAPYMHNGSLATLEDVVEFYDDGEIFRNPELSSQFRAVDLSRRSKDELIDFMTNALTDCRVEKRRAPFDHPSLPLPNGTALAATGAAGIGSCP